MQVIFCRSNKIGSRIIRFVTWSRWSHVALVNDDGMAIEAVWPRVRMVPVAEIMRTHSESHIVEVEHAPDEVWRAALSQVGKPYDLGAVLGFLFRRDWQDASKWDCAELVAWSFAAGGRALFRETYLPRITPQHLWMLARF